MSGKTGLDRVEVYIDMLQRLDIYGWTWSALSHHLHPDPSPAPAYDCAQAFEKICDLNLYLHFMFSPAPVLKIMRYMSLSIGVISWNKQCYVEWKIAHSSLNLSLKNSENLCTPWLELRLTDLVPAAVPSHLHHGLVLQVNDDARFSEPLVGWLVKAVETKHFFAVTLNWIPI